MSSPAPGSRNLRKTIVGFVTSRSGDKSIKVTIPYKTPHPLYHKVINRKTVVHAHDEQNDDPRRRQGLDHGDPPDQPAEALAGRRASSSARSVASGEAISETDVAAQVPTKTTKATAARPDAEPSA